MFTIATGHKNEVNEQATTFHENPRSHESYRSQQVAATE